MIKNILFWVCTCLFISIQVNAQSSAAPCNMYSPLISDTYNNLEVVSSTIGTLFPSDQFSNKENLISSNLDSYASWTTVLLGSAWIEVKDNSAVGTETYPAGTYAGFVMGEVDLVSLGTTLTVTTYLGNQEQESVNFSSLVGLLGSSKSQVGFVTSEPFDRVRLSINAGLAVGTFTARVYYAEILKPCTPEPLVCNEMTALVQGDGTNTGHSVVIEPERTGFTGVTLGELVNPMNIVNSDTDDYASLIMPVGLLATGSVSVRDIGETYTAGHFAGFEISNTNLLSIDLLNSVTIETYLNGDFQENSGNNLSLLDVPLIDSNQRNVVGFITTKDFDEIRYVVNQPVTIDIEATRIYNAVIKEYCAGPELECNTDTKVYSPLHPVDINGARTGIDALICAGCAVDNPNNVIDGDDSTYAQITTVAGVLGGGAISVKNGFESYSSGNYVAFEVLIPELLNLELLGSTSIELYNNNELVQTASGNSQLISGGTSIIGGVNRGLIGMVSEVEFDEARLVISNLLQVDLGTVNVYNFYVTNVCEGEFDCDTSAPLEKPDFSVVIENSRTGINSGVACVGCSIKNSWNLVNQGDDPARINLTLGAVGSSGSISVRDLTVTYPAGTLAGFVIADVNNFLQIGLLSDITIETYMDGVLQESRSGNSQLIDLDLILPLLGTGPGQKPIGFTTSMPFNEIRITYSIVLQLLNYLDVYHAFVDGGYAEGCDCTKPGNFIASQGLATSVGISSLRTDQLDGWPNVREGAWVALESKTKGFVPNRLTQAQVEAIPAEDLVEGMMIYNIDQDCLQINVDGNEEGWKCYNFQSCN